MIGGFMSQLHYDPREIMERLELERQKMGRAIFEEAGYDFGDRGRDLFSSVDPNVFG